MTNEDCKHEMVLEQDSFREICLSCGQNVSMWDRVISDGLKWLSDLLDSILEPSYDPNPVKSGYYVERPSIDVDVGFTLGQDFSGFDRTISYSEIKRHEWTR